MDGVLDVLVLPANQRKHQREVHIDQTRYNTARKQDQTGPQYFHTVVDYQHEGALEDEEHVDVVVVQKPLEPDPLSLSERHVARSRSKGSLSASPRTISTEFITQIRQPYDLEPADNTKRALFENSGLREQLKPAEIEMRNPGRIQALTSEKKRKNEKT